MALIIRIVTFIITLFFIIILLLGATTSFSTEWYESDLYPMKFRVLSPKELLIDQLNIQNEFKEIESHEEWTERAYLYYPLVEFDDDEDVIICGAQLIIIEPSGHNIKYEKGIFGAPTFVSNNKIFWGQDRIEFVLNEANK